MQNQTLSTQYTIEDHLCEECIDKVEIRFGQTGVSLCCRIDLFTGHLLLTWSEDQLDHWCEESLNDIRVCIEARLSLQQALNHQYEYCLLFAVRDAFKSVNTHYSCMYIHLDSRPALLIPCHIDRDITNASLFHHYQLILTLVPQTQGRIASSVSFSAPSPEALLRRGGPSYHSINNKMDGLNQMEGEIGFNIDDETQNASDTETSSSLWNLEILGRYEGVSSKNLEEVHHICVCDPSSSDFREQVCYSILRVLPILRFQSLHQSMASLSKNNYVTNVMENPQQRTVSVLISYHYDS